MYNFGQWWPDPMISNSVAVMTSCIQKHWGHQMWRRQRNVLKHAPNKTHLRPQDVVWVIGFKKSIGAVTPLSTLIWKHGNIFPLITLGGDLRKSPIFHTSSCGMTDFSFFRLERRSGQAQINKKHKVEVNRRSDFFPRCSEERFAPERVTSLGSMCDHVCQHSYLVVAVLHYHTVDERCRVTRYTWARGTPLPSFRDLRGTRGLRWWNKALTLSA